MKDFIIVGFGISGLSIANALDDFKKDYVIISDRSQNATQAAGGLINPVMLKTGKLVWNIEEFIPFAKEFYASIHLTAFTAYPIHRIFNSIEEQNNQVAVANSMNQNFVSSQLIKPYAGIKAPLKMSKVNGGGVINIQHVLKLEQNRHRSNKQFQFSTFDFNQLQVYQDYIEYKTIKARHIIFTEGFGITQNPYFKGLPVQGNKGEYILIQSTSLQLKAILKNKYFLIPLGNDIYKYGATYSRNELNNIPSKKAREELRFHLDKILTCDYQIIDQVAGIRPTVKDKKPIYGTHTDFKRLHIFNGMGSRGLLMAPLLAKELIQNIEEEIPLRDEINLKRFMNP